MRQREKSSGTLRTPGVKIGVNLVSLGSGGEQTKLELNQCLLLPRLSLRQETSTYVVISDVTTIWMSSSKLVLAKTLEHHH